MKTFPLWWSFIINSSKVYSNKRWYHQDDFEKLVTCIGHVPPSGVHRGAAGAKKAAWTGANWKRIDFPPKFQLDLSSAHVYSTNPSFPPLALIGLQSFLPPLLALTAFLNEPQKFSSISCKGKFSLGNDQVWCGQKYHLLMPSSDLHFPRFSVAFTNPNDLYSYWFIFPLNESSSEKNAFSGYLAIWRHTYKEDECQKSVELPEKTNKLIWCNVRKLELVSREKKIFFPYCQVCSDWCQLPACLIYTLIDKR